MKKLLFFLMSALFIFNACQQNEEITGSNEPKSKTSNRFYGVQYPEKGISTKAAGQRIKFWYPCSEIRVKFLNGTTDYQEKVKNYAAEWEQYAGIKFKFVTEGQAEVRVGFDWNENRYITWSYVGTDCKMVTDQNDATMSFADWAWATEEERKGDVLRAFGQVLGLELEHRHLDFDANWTDRISEYWEGEITDVPWDILKQYVFDPMLESGVIQTSEYDENSIMVWPFTRRYAGNTARYFNYELSDMDKEFIGQVYPKDQCEEKTIIEMDIETSDESITAILHFFIDDDIIIDWGDGTKENKNSDYYMLLHTYQNAGNYTIRVLGEPHAITLLRFGYVGELNSLDISKATSLTELGMSSSNISSLDLSKNTELRALVITGSPNIQTLDLTNNNKIEQVHFSGSGITDIYGISGKPELTTVSCYDTQLVSLDVSNCPKLETIVCDNGSLVSMNISNNPKLRHLECYNNPLTSNLNALLNIAAMLPQKEGRPDDYGVWLLDGSELIPQLESICTPKNWEIN